MRDRRVAMIVPDVFFAARIAATAEAAGVALQAIEMEEPPGRAIDTLATAGIDLVLVDLSHPGALDRARRLRLEPHTAAMPVVGFYAHVDEATRRAAEAAGIQTLPRAAFTRRLADILRGN